MASVGALGIGLSVVFGVFLVLLLAELYYLLFWKRKSPRINSVSPNDPAGGAGAGSELQQPAIVAKMFETRDGVSAHIGMVGLDGECVLAPPRLLFTIKEETREDLADSEDAMKKPPRVVMKSVNPPPDHVVVQVFQSDLSDVRERERSLLHVCSSSSEASSSSSSSRSSEDEQVDQPEDEETGLTMKKAVSERGDEDEETVCTTPFVTPPSSPSFSTPSSSPLRSSSSSQYQAPRASSGSSCYESPPSPPLVPMPVLPRNNSTGSSRSLLMNSPPLTPPSTSSRESKRSRR